MVQLAAPVGAVRVIVPERVKFTALTLCTLGSETQLTRTRARVVAGPVTAHANEPLVAVVFGTFDAIGLHVVPPSRLKSMFTRAHGEPGVTRLDIPLGTPQVAALTLTDNDTAGEVQFAATAFSGLASKGFLTVTVTRSGGTAGPVSVVYATGGGTAVEDVDYMETTGILTFAPDEMTKAIVIPVWNTGPPNKHFFVTLGATTGNLRLGASTRASVWIVE